VPWEVIGTLRIGPHRTMDWAALPIPWEPRMVAPRKVTSQPVDCAEASETLGPAISLSGRHPFGAERTWQTDRTRPEEGEPLP
jgi:hypothetical protein